MTDDRRKGARPNGTSAAVPGEGVSRPRRATIEVVAEAAGVSVATVSRALRGLPNVAASTRARVERAAAELGYRADPAASRLAAGRSTTIVAVVPHLAGWFFATVVAGMEAVCDEEGYDLIVASVASPEEFDRLAGDVGQLERRADGLVTVDIAVPDEIAVSLRQRKIATATIGTRTSEFPSVWIDEEAVSELAVDHLVSLGHRRIALIGGGTDSPLGFEVPRRRKNGFRSALERRALPVVDQYLRSGNFGIDDGQEAMCDLLDLEDPPTAVFAMSDEMAFGALMELRRRGLAPGTDISVVGVDNHEFARVVDLTTVHQPVADHGARATRLVIGQLRNAADRPGAAPCLPDGGANAATTVEAAIDLVVRSTTGPPPLRAESG